MSLGITALAAMQFAVASVYLRGGPQHGDLWPPDLRDAAGFALAACSLFIAAGGGIGGGALLVPILLIVMSASVGVCVSYSKLLEPAAIDGEMTVSCSLYRVPVSILQMSASFGFWESDLVHEGHVHVITADFQPDNAVALSNVTVVGGGRSQNLDLLPLSDVPLQGDRCRFHAGCLARAKSTCLQPSLLQAPLQILRTMCGSDTLLERRA